jgi:hypothetical protein
MMLRSLFAFALLVAFASPLPAQRLSPMAGPPDWSALEPFQETITRGEFVRLLETVYAPNGAARGFIEVEGQAARIQMTLTPPTEFRLRFAEDTPSAKKVPRSWRPASTLKKAPKGKPLAGVKIAIDPGHLGGEWARIEERFFQIGESTPVREGDMTLRVAELLAPQLTRLGAEVTLLRTALEPLTPDRPETLREVAREELARLGVAAPRETYDPAVKNDPTRGETVQWQSEILFYRYSEIRHRARRVNELVQPDLVLCLHFNAEAWGDDPTQPVFVPRNHLHLLVNGNYAAAELRNDDVRLDLLLRLLSRSYAEELAASETVAGALATATHLPPYEYTTPNAMRVGTTKYVWARNLLANRLYRAPVLFLEPYVMNSQEVWQRVQDGDFEGWKLSAGALRKSIYREYADAVAAGLRDYYERTRR